MSATTSPANAATLMTADEFWVFCGLPENDGRAFELAKGEVVEMPSPTKRHGRVCFRIGYLLERYSEESGGGYVVTNDSGILLEREPDTVAGPDVAYFTDATAFDQIHPKWSETPPLLAVEVLSPSDRMKEVLVRVGDFLRNGIRLVWLVNYEERYLTVFAAGQPPVIVNENDPLPPFPDLPGFTCTVADFFRLPGPPTA